MIHALLVEESNFNIPERKEEIILDGCKKCKSPDFFPWQSKNFCVCTLAHFAASLPKKILYYIKFIATASSVFMASRVRREEAESRLKEEFG